MSRERFCVGFGRTRIDIEGERGRAVLGELWPLAGGGTLRVREEDLWVYLEAVRPDDGRGLYKVWCTGPQGEFLLGTLVPQGGSLHLERRVARKTLQQAGAWPLIGGKTVMAYSFTDRDGVQEVWRREDHPENFCRDRVVRACLRGARGGSAGRRGRSGSWRYPFRPVNRFYLTHYFAWRKSGRSRDSGIWCGALTGRGGLCCLGRRGRKTGKNKTNPLKNQKDLRIIRKDYKEEMEQDLCTVSIL